MARRTATARPRRSPTSSSARRSLPATGFVLDAGRRRRPPAGRRPLAHGLHRAQLDADRRRRRRLLHPRGRRLSTGRRPPRRPPSPAVDARVPLRRSVVLVDRSENGHRVHAQGKPQYSTQYPSTHFKRSLKLYTVFRKKSVLIFSANSHH